MLKARSIKRACSTQGFAVLIDRKKYGLLRFCINYRALNKHIKARKFFIPTVEEVIKKMVGEKVFQKLTCLPATGSCSLEIRTGDHCIYM